MFVVLCRVARTVIFGGLLNADMAEDVHRRAREIGTVINVTYPFPKEELQRHGMGIFFPIWYLFSWIISSLSGLYFRLELA